MKANKSSIGLSVDQPDARTRFYLFHGPDEAQSRALADRLLRALGASKVPLATGEIKSEAGSLAIAAGSMSLFGDPQAVWIEPAGEDIVAGIEELLRADAVAMPVVAVAGALKKSSALAKLADGSPLALSFIAYLPEGPDAERMVIEIGRRLGLKVSPAVAARVADRCANDQAIVARELEKLALYADASPHAPKELDHDAVDAVAAESSEGEFLRLADLALRGDMEPLSDELARLSGAGAEAVPIIRSLQRRLLMLAPARARVERGERLDAVMASFGKSLFWKDKPTVHAMLAKWSAEDLARVAERTGTLERELMFTDVPPAGAIGEHLVAIARKARSVRR